LSPASTSALHTRLCAPDANGACTFPDKVVLEDAIACQDQECLVDYANNIQIIHAGSTGMAYLICLLNYPLAPAYLPTCTHPHSHTTDSGHCSHTALTLQAGTNLYAHPASDLPLPKRVCGPKWPTTRVPVLAIKAHGISAQT
jgi:hypothetical protein